MLLEIIDRRFSKNHGFCFDLLFHGPSCSKGNVALDSETKKSRSFKAPISIRAKDGEIGMVDGRGVVRLCTADAARALDRPPAAIGSLC